MLLGDRYLTTIKTRAAYLLGVYPRRYKKLLAAPRWDDEELDELGHSLRANIEITEMQRRDIEYRIEHLNLTAVTGGPATRSVHPTTY